MIGNRRNYRNSVLTIALAGAMVIMLFVFTVKANESRMAFRKYPKMKLGFSTVTFLTTMEHNVDSAKKLIDYASDNGYLWIELRDSEVTLTLDECKELAAYAKARNVEVGYAMQINLFNADFWSKVHKAIKNAQVFAQAFPEGPKTFRTLAGLTEFLDDKEKIGWNAEEFKRLVLYANAASQLAEDHGLFMCFENALEVLKGNGKNLFGIKEFFRAVNDNVYFQFDTANFFSAAKVWTKPEDALCFIKDNIYRMKYIHLKTSTAEHKTGKALSDNELDFEVIFDLLAANDVHYVAIELSPAKTAEECFKNLEKSIRYLKNKGFIISKPG